MSKILESVIKALAAIKPMVVYASGVLWLTFMAGVQYNEVKRTKLLIEVHLQRSVTSAEVEDMFVGYDRLRTNGMVSERTLRTELRDIHDRHYVSRK